MKTIWNTVRVNFLLLACYLVQASQVFALPTTNTVEMRQYNGTGWVPLQLAPIASSGLLQMSAAGVPSFAATANTTALNVNGTAGTGFLRFSAETTPSAGGVGFVTLYGDASDRFTFSSGTGGTGYFTTFDTTANSASRVYTFPDRTDTVVTLGATQTLTGKTLTTPTIASVTMGNADTVVSRIGAGNVGIDSTANTPALSLRESGTTRGFILTASGNMSVGTVNGSGTLTFSSGNQVTALTLDASQNALFAGNAKIPAGSQFQFTGRSVIGSSADGILELYNNAASAFTRLNFGGTSSSFPAIKRNGAIMEVILADNSDTTVLGAKSFIAEGAASSIPTAGQIAYGGTTASTVGAAGGASALPATPTGYIIINVAGTAKKIPYYDN